MIEKLLRKGVAKVDENPSDSDNIATWYTRSILACEGM